jgi:hypothetical protein
MNVDYFEGFASHGGGFIAEAYKRHVAFTFSLEVDLVWSVVKYSLLSLQ